MYELYLAHHGILGMKWGIRRFQNKDGSLTTAGERRYSGGNGKNPRHKPTSARKLAKQRAANLEKARQAKAAKKEFEEEKKKALESGSAADVLKYKGSLSNQELSSAYQRLNYEKLLTDMVPKVKTGWDKADDIMNKVGKLTDYANKGISAYNVLAKINNTFSDSKMKIISEKSEKTESKKVEKNEGKKSSENQSSENKSSDSKAGFTAKDQSSQKRSNSSEPKASKETKTNKKGASSTGPVNDGQWIPKPGKDYTTDSQRSKSDWKEAEKRAKEWASKRPKDFYEATWTDVVDSSFTSSGRNYTKTSDFMTLSSGQVIPLLPEHK